LGLGAGPGDRTLVIDIGTIYGVAGCQKHGAGWRACMATAGYDYEKPRAMLEEFLGLPA